MKAEELQLKYQCTGIIVEEEMDFLFSEISHLQAENERLQNLIGDRDAEIATAFEQGRIFGNGEVEDKIQTAEQRVARECLEIMREMDECTISWEETFDKSKDAIKQKYHLEDE